MERGPGGITHQAVAERAGVGRATAYRHWPRPEDLLLDALRGADRSLLHPLDGPLREWLGRELRRLSGELSTPATATMLLAVAEHSRHDPEVDALREAVQTRTIAQLDDALGQAVADGTLAASPSGAMLLAQLVGPLLYRAIFQATAVDGEFIDTVVEGALAPWEPAPT
jgi:AcrR family transcriptional regulator